MPFGKCVTDIVQRHVYDVALARLQSERLLVVLAMRQIQKPIGYTVGGAVRGDVVQTNSNESHGPVCGELLCHNGTTENFRPVPESLRIERQ